MPFERMAKAIDEWAGKCEEEVIVQTGHTSYPYRHAKAFGFCTKEEMKRYMEEASMVILQGGWGTINEAMEMGKRIVVMPRHNHTEHIHDQFQLVKKLDSMGCVVGVFDEKLLAEKIRFGPPAMMPVIPKESPFSCFLKGRKYIAAAGIKNNGIKKYFTLIPQK